MGFSEAVQWWDEWQLRILVLCSLFLQCFLFFAGAMRKRCIPSFLRFLIWLAYLGSDAVATYALATLFIRNKKSEWVSTHRSIVNLQLLWAPILLVHLGGQNGITAYNIEDNELWRRHVLTAVSQVTVAIYVFCKTWSGNKRILGQGILLFIFGIFKCILKPFDLKKVSINSLVDSYHSEENGKDPHSLHQLVRVAARYVEADHGDQQPSATSSSEDNNPLEVDRAYDLFVDLAPSYSDRLTCLKYLVYHGEKAHRLLQSCLSATFDLLYTNEQRIGSSYMCNFLDWSNYLKVLVAGSLTLVVLSFHNRKKEEAYRSIDVKITDSLLWCTVILEYYIPIMRLFMNLLKHVRCVGTIHRMIHGRPWPDHVRQYLVRNKSHSWFRKLAALFICKDYIDRLWQMKPPNSSREITKLAHGYIAKGGRNVT